MQPNKLTLNSQPPSHQNQVNQLNLLDLSLQEQSSHFSTENVANSNEFPQTIQSVPEQLMLLRPQIEAELTHRKFEREDKVLGYFDPVRGKFFDFRGWVLTHRRVPGDIVQIGNRTVLHIATDGLCYFRAVMCLYTKNHSYATTASCSSEKLQRKFLTRFDAEFKISIREAMKMAIELTMAEVSQLTLKILDKLLNLIKTDLSLLHDEETMLDIIIKFVPEVERKNVKSIISFFCDAAFTLLNKYISSPELRLLNGHYDLFLD